ncbi:MAG TPA: hypothetical protein VHY48_10515 [Acidobacteriaceae bacterium]|jgi:hypothetical protein|nr:hypothetical protein [Acidobacteriaceae bacterium]
MPLRATEVFTPGAFPVHTYVERSQEGFESALADALATPGQVVSLSGPSKSGKTVLVEKVVGQDQLIPVSGVSIRHPDDVWRKVLDWMDLPMSSTVTNTYGVAGETELSAKGSVGFKFVAKGEAGGRGQIGGSFEKSAEEVRDRRGLPQVVSEIADSDFVVLIDDFHYMPRDVQSEVAKSLKEAVRLNIKIVAAAVTHRGDDLLRANSELRGRVRSVDLRYWSADELTAIARTGFGVLNADLSQTILQQFVTESAGSPQLMQLLCLNTCFVTNLREKYDGMFPAVLNVGKVELQRILEQTSSNTDFRSLVDVLDAGPRTRGTERKTYRFRDGMSGDVYSVVLRALAFDPPKLSFTYDELVARTAAVCEGESPVGSSVTGTCLHMSKLAEEKFPSERAVDWDESKQVFDVPDPYFMFYLRWSGRLREGT